MYYIINSRGEVVGSANGAVNTEDLAAFGSIVVHSDLTLPPFEVAVTGFPSQPRVIEQPKEQQPVLRLSTSAKDRDGDGVAELKANGRDRMTITVEAQTAGGESIRNPVVVMFRTTSGRLSARTAELSDGSASVNLTAGRETVLVQVTATAPGFDAASLTIEFVP